MSLVRISLARFKLTILSLEFLETPRRQSSAPHDSRRPVPLDTPLTRGLRRTPCLRRDQRYRRPLRFVLMLLHKTIRTARTLSSGEYLLRLTVTPSSQELESPGQPGAVHAKIVNVVGDQRDATLNNLDSLR